MLRGPLASRLRHRLHLPSPAMDAHTHSPRQLLLMCDGTNSNLTGGKADTNVVKLSELAAAEPDPQRLVYYDPGVGNSGELPGATMWDGARRMVDRINGLAFGRGVYENMAECYLFLMRHYRPGDELFIFGFSRGAFTARSVAGLVNQFGILRPQMESMVPTLLHIYFADRSDSGKLKDIAQQVSRHFASADTRQVDIQFVGVWDTVASVGVAPFNTKFTALPTPDKKAFVHVRQALALDEHRSQFKPRLYAGDNGPFVTRSGRTGSLDQRWFSGSHCDIGGGFSVAESGLSDLAFAWLVSEAVQCGLRLTANGVALDNEPAVRQRLAEVHRPIPGDRTLRVHSELRDTAAWAVTGMCVRDTHRVVMDDGAAQDVRPEEHPANAGLKLTMARNGSWTRLGTPWPVWAALALLPLGVLLLGQLLHGTPTSGGLLGYLQTSWHLLGDYWQRNVEFQHWQLLGWLNPAWPASVAADPWSLQSWFAADAASLHPGNFAAPRWAVFWDFGVMACYATVLSWFAAVSFARIAGLRHAGDPVPRWLNVLGLALPVGVLGDAGENLFTWLSLTAGGNDVVSLAVALHIAAALCAVAKFIGLSGAIVLIASGCMRSDRHRAGH